MPMYECVYSSTKNTQQRIWNQPSTECKKNTNWNNLLGFSNEKKRSWDRCHENRFSSRKRNRKRQTRNRRTKTLKEERTMKTTTATELRRRIPSSVCKTYRPSTPLLQRGLPKSQSMCDDCDTSIYRREEKKRGNNVRTQTQQHIGIRNNFTEENNKVDVWPWLYFCCFSYCCSFASSVGRSVSIFADGLFVHVYASAFDIRDRLMNFIAPFSIVISTETNLSHTESVQKVTVNSIHWIRRQRINIYDKIYRKYTSTENALKFTKASM